MCERRGSEETQCVRGEGSEETQCVRGEGGCSEGGGLLALGPGAGDMGRAKCPRTVCPLCGTGSGRGACAHFPGVFSFLAM